MKRPCACLLGLCVAMLWAQAAIAVETVAAPATQPGWRSRANSLPRKVVIASAVADITGPVDARLRTIGRMIDDAAREAAASYPGHGLDLVVFPEFTLLRESGTTAAERAVALAGPVIEALAAKARAHHTWLVVPMTLKEEGDGEKFSNAAVLLDRSGAVAGIFRKVHRSPTSTAYSRAASRPAPVTRCSTATLAGWASSSAGTWRTTRRGMPWRLAERNSWPFRPRLPKISGRWPRPCDIIITW